MRINELGRVARGNPHRDILSRQAADHLQINVTVKLILKYETSFSCVSIISRNEIELYRERDGTSH